MTVTVTRHYKLLEKVCPVCGKTFWGPKVKVYCTGRGGACASRANYERHAEQYRRKRMRKYYEERAEHA